MSKKIIAILVLLIALSFSACTVQEEVQTDSSSNDVVVQGVETSAPSTEISTEASPNFDLKSHKDSISAVESLLEYY